MPTALWFNVLPFRLGLGGGACWGLRRWRGCLLCLGLAWHGGAFADVLLDFGLFDVPLPAQRVQSQPVMRWLVRQDAEQFCAQAQPQDGHASRPGGCVFWQVDAGRCTMVTTASTTHSLMGHLFLHCLQGK